MHGEGFVVYFPDRSTLANKSLDSPLIEKTFKNGRGLDASNRIQVTEEYLLSLCVRVDVFIPLDKLGEIPKANPDVQMGLYFSLPLWLFKSNVQHGSSIKERATFCACPHLKNTYGRNV
jgi:hypothetical protein